jgi:uncharacterized protein YkwD
MVLLFLLTSCLSPLERSVVEEVNQLRKDPAAYTEVLESHARHYRGKVVRLPGELPLVTKEGIRAALEAIRALRQSKPSALLGISCGLSRAAQDHAREQGPRGLISHTGTDGSGPDERATRHAAAPVSAGENISYGPRDARRVVIELLIDDGVPGRGHRLNLLHPESRFVGVGCGRHAIHGTMCVLDFAIEFHERPDLRRGQAPKSCYP